VSKEAAENQARPASGRAFLSNRGISLPDIKAHILFWGLLLTGLALDLWSKRAIFQNIDSPNGGIRLIDGFLRLIRTQNPGAAFGIASGQRMFLIIISVVALLAVLIMFLLSGKERRIIQSALGLFAGGVAGNLYDRIFNQGLVRDFIDVTYWPGRHWPAFNVADVLLCTAVGLLILGSFTQKSSRKHPQTRK